MNPERQTMAPEPIKAIVIEIERWSVSDGPGTRTVVFLKGCPLKCPWCANPESQDRRPQMGIFAVRCVECGACQRECPQDVAVSAKDGAFGDGECIGCGRCIQFCHSGARTWLGEEMSVDQVMGVIKKDMVFYRRSGGGVTFSGGEPLTQPGFLKALISECRKLGVHTAIETCGFFDWESAREAFGEVDFVLFDLKHMDAGRHRALTGVSSGRIHANAKRISGLGIPMLIRIPVIPSINDSRANIKASAQFVRDHLPSALGIEILPYHRLGLNKYAALGLDYGLPHIEPPAEAHIKDLQNLISSTGVTCFTVDHNTYQPSERPHLRVVH